MVKFVDWLSEHKALNLAIVLVYSVLILPMHNHMARTSVKIMEYFSWQYYDIIVASLAGICLLAITWYFLKKLKEYRHATELKIFYLVAVLSLLFLHLQMNLVLNIELIHTVEFGILALLMFPLTKRFGDTAFY